MFTGSGRLTAPVLTIGVSALALAALAGCGADVVKATGPAAPSGTAQPIGPAREPSPSEPARPAGTASTSASAPAAAAGSTRPASRAGEAAALFVQLVTSSCQPSESTSTEPLPDPHKATVRPGSSSKIWKVTDTQGQQVLIDLGSPTVYSTQGPKAELPAVYTFECDPRVFVGSRD